MFNEFLSFFGQSCDTPIRVNDERSNKFALNATGFSGLLNSFGGHSFGKGLYRLHKSDEIEQWNSLITEGFPEYAGRIECFGFDWLGRQFALDSQREQGGQPQVLMFEPGTGQVLEIPCSFLEFHNEEIPSYHDACLASDFFSVWLSIHPSGIAYEHCAGYKKPLFIGGEDAVDNLEETNTEVYWSICSQLLLKTRGLSDGTVINIKGNV